MSSGEGLTANPGSHFQDKILCSKNQQKSQSQSGEERKVDALTGEAKSAITVNLNVSTPERLRSIKLQLYQSEVTDVIGQT